MLFYFSGVGNSARVANDLSKILGDTCLCIADEILQSKDYVLRADEMVGFVFPVYSWAPPRIVLDFVRKLSFTSQPSFIYMVCTCGDDTGKTAEIFSHAMEAKGWSLQASYSVFMPNTYVCLPGFDVDGEDVAARKLNEEPMQVAGIAEKIRQRILGHFCHEGALPALKSYAIAPLFNRFLCSPRWFFATDACISCKKCEKACPVHNISFKRDGKPQWGAHCTMCLACYHTCPVHAVQYGKFTRTKGQYLPPKP